jgi:acyl dehydratase
VFGESAAPMKYFEDIEVGYVEETPSLVADRDEMVEYAARHDPYPIHIDEEAARRTAVGGLIASWGYTVSLFLRLLHLMKLDQDLSDAFLWALEWRVQFGRPVRPGDETA